MTQFDQRYQHVDTQYNAEQITIQQQPVSLTEKQHRQDRTRMLNRVQMIWIDGVLVPSLQGATPIALELESRPSAVIPLWHVLQEFDKTGPLSSADTSIVQVYDNAGGELLILGEPGAGKTTLLLQLTRALLERARQDEAHPIPVVFSLSSWATKQQALTEWLESELSNTYHVPSQTATAWIKTDQVLPLLDGLDEVATPYQTACIQAINFYRQTHGLLPTVVCSRQANYLAHSSRLLLRTAMVVQPLSTEQIDLYLETGGARLEALHQALHEDADLRVLASTPLMLNVLTTAYQGTQFETFSLSDSLPSKQHHIFTTYVQRMLNRRSVEPPYTQEHIQHWLTWLAGQMKNRNITEFSLGLLQPTWLSTKRLQILYRVLNVIFYGLMGGLLYGLLFGLIGGSYFSSFSLAFELLVGLLFGLISGFFAWRLSRNEIRPRLPWKYLARYVEIRFVEQSVWTWRKALLAPLAFVMIFGLIMGVLYRSIYMAVYGLVYALFFGLVFWIIILLAIWLFVPLARRWLRARVSKQNKELTPKRDENKQNLKPNQFILYSARYALYKGLTFGLIFVFIFGLIESVSGQGNFLVLGLTCGLILGLLGGLNTGRAYLQHYALRFLLWRNGTMPWHYVRFLDYAAERILLRRVGGNYIFLHRLLLDYFADMETKLIYNETAESRKEGLSTITIPSESVMTTGAHGILDVGADQLASPSVLTEIPQLLPCGHEQSAPNARFCSTCGLPIPLSPE
jgi:NACHT domain